MMPGNWLRGHSHAGAPAAEASMVPSGAAGPGTARKIKVLRAASELWFDSRRRPRMPPRGPPDARPRRARDPLQRPAADPAAQRRRPRRRQRCTGVDPHYRIVERWRVGGEGGWDYLTVEPGRGRLCDPDRPRLRPRAPPRVLILRQ